MAEPLLLPIGQFFGTADGAHAVRVGGEVRRLDAPRFGTWALLHGIPDRLEAAPWNRDAMRGVAPGPHAVTDAVIDALIGDGLAAEVDPAAAVEFARAHRMGHRLLGLGNTEAEPWLYAIGLFDQPVVRVTVDVYDLWDTCELSDSLWTTCSTVAPADPAELLEGFLRTIHHLLTMSVVYLEPRR